MQGSGVLSSCGTKHCRPDLCFPEKEYHTLLSLPQKKRTVGDLAARSYQERPNEAAC